MNPNPIVGQFVSHLQVDCTWLGHFCIRGISPPLNNNNFILFSFHNSASLSSSTTHTVFIIFHLTRSFNFKLDYFFRSCLLLPSSPITNQPLSTVQPTTHPHTKRRPRPHILDHSSTFLLSSSDYSSLHSLISSLVTQSPLLAPKYCLRDFSPSLSHCFSCSFSSPLFLS